MNLEQKAHELMMSPTLERLHQMAIGIPFDVHNPDELKTMLATCGADVISALDDGRIHFSKMEDKAAFYGLLTVTTDYVMDGNIRTAFKQATMN
jgi:hypothetical protein